MQNYKIAIVVSQFNQKITSLMERSAVERLKELDIRDYRVVQVPGAIELPIMAKKFALEGYDAVIVLGAVIRGETSHYDYVCNQVSYGCQKISLEQMVPVIFGVLTCETEAQAYDRIGGGKGNKPKEMVDAAVTMIDLLR